MSEVEMGPSATTNENRSKEITRVTSSQGDYDVHVGLNTCHDVLSSLLNQYPSSKLILATDQTIDEHYSLEFDSIFKNRPEMSFQIKQAGRVNNEIGDEVAKDAGEIIELNEFCAYQFFSDKSKADVTEAREWYKCILPPGEINKTMGCMAALLEIMAHCNLNRSDILIAFGGGVIGDLAGFAASSYMRGIGYIQIPTTLLAMTDSSVGGKVAVNLKGGKNLAGHFYSPIKVISDIRYLRTLDERNFIGGMAEVVKYGFIKDPDILEVIETSESDKYFSDKALEQLIVKCVQVKALTVSKDEFESGLRMILNYGHTFGHGIESVYHYERYNHGEAIALGMIIMEYFTEWLVKSEGRDSIKILEGFKPAEIVDRRNRLINLLRILGLPHEPEVLKNLPMSEMKKFVFKDKKSSSTGIKMVMIESIGKACVLNVPNSVVEVFMDGWNEIFQGCE